MRDLEIHADGLGFLEGPVCLPDGSVAFVDLLHQKVRAWSYGRVREICAVPGSPNGMRLGPDGALYVANNGGLSPDRSGTLRFPSPQITGRIQKIGADGVVSDVATELPGMKPWRPNDLVFSPRGDIVFTDPQNWEALSDPATRPNYHGGQLVLSTLEGRTRQLAELTGFPNGLAFHPDGSLIVGLTVERRLLRFPWLGDAVGEGSQWCAFGEGFAPDGMAFDGDRLFVSGSSGDRIAVVDADGAIKEVIDTGPGSDPTNLCIDGDRIWVTLGLPGRLVSYRI
jgi:sugar lactone lactonase YvrE